MNYKRTEQKRLYLVRQNWLQDMPKIDKEFVLKQSVFVENDNAYFIDTTAVNEELTTDISFIETLFAEVETISSML